MRINLVIGNFLAENAKTRGTNCFYFKHVLLIFMKKMILVIVVASIIIVALVAWMFIPSTPTTPTPVTPVTPPIMPITPPPFTQPVSSTSTSVIPWSMSTEILKKLENAWVRNDDSFIWIRKENYTLGYSNLFDVYTIGVISEPADVYRHEAEQDLLQTLEISEAQMCLLDVNVIRSTELTLVRGPKEFQTIGLSFCPDGLSDAEVRNTF